MGLVQGWMGRRHAFLGGMSPRKNGRHLGLVIDESVGAKLDALLADEKAKVGPYATVSQVGFIVGLIEAEYVKRGLGGSGGKESL